MYPFGFCLNPSFRQTAFISVFAVFVINLLLHLFNLFLQLFNSLTLFHCLFMFLDYLLFLHQSLFDYLLHRLLLPLQLLVLHRQLRKLALSLSLPVQPPLLLKLLPLLGNLVLYLVLTPSKLFLQVAQQNELHSLLNFGFQFLFYFIQQFLRCENSIYCLLDKFLLLFRCE